MEAHLAIYQGSRFLICTDAPDETGALYKRFGNRIVWCKLLSLDRDNPRQEWTR